MKLNKEDKHELKFDIKLFLEGKGSIHILEGGITRVYMPVSQSKHNRMYWYGQSVCNPTDKYKKKIGIFLALRDCFTTEKTIPVELIGMEFESDLMLDFIKA